MTSNAPRHYRIFNAYGEHVATVKPEFVEAQLAAENARREIDIDGNPIGECVARPFDGFVQGDS